MILLIIMQNVWSCFPPGHSNQQQISSESERALCPIVWWSNLFKRPDLILLFVGLSIRFDLQIWSLVFWRSKNLRETMLMILLWSLLIILWLGQWYILQFTRARALALLNQSYSTWTRTKNCWARSRLALSVLWVPTFTVNNHLIIG